MKFIYIHGLCYLCTLIDLFPFTYNSSQVEVISNCSILAAVGQKMASTPGVSATLFDALAKVLASFFLSSGNAKFNFFQSFLLCALILSVMHYYYSG